MKSWIIHDVELIWSMHKAKVTTKSIKDMKRLSSLTNDMAVTSVYLVHIEVTFLTYKYSVCRITSSCGPLAQLVRADDS